MELTDGSLRLAGTDLEHTGEVTIEVAGDDTGRVVVPGRIFGDIVRNLPDGLVQVHAADGTLKVDCGQVSHELRLLDVADFPTLAEPSLDQALTLPGASFAAAAAQVGRAAAHDDARPVLSGVLVEAAAAQLAGHHRLLPARGPRTGLHLVTRPHQRADPGPLPGRGRPLLSGEDSVTVALEAHQADHRGRLPPPDHPPHRGEFPKFRALIPSGYESTATVDRQALLDALKQVSPYSINNVPVRLTFTTGQVDLDLTLQDVGTGHAEVAAKYKGDTLIAAFNPAYLADGIAGVTTGRSSSNSRTGSSRR